jgi:hypothetical protein
MAKLEEIDIIKILNYGVMLDLSLIMNSRMMVMKFLMNFQSNQISTKKPKYLSFILILKRKIQDSKLVHYINGPKNATRKNMKSNSQRKKKQKQIIKK